MSIATEISRLQTAKANLKTAIEGKGVTVPSSTTLDGYASLVDAIQTGGGSTGLWSSTDVTASNTLSNAAEVKTWIETLLPASYGIAIVIRNADYNTAPSVNNQFIFAVMLNGFTTGKWCRYRSGSYDSQWVWTVLYDLVVSAGDSYSILYSQDQA